jgi:beta-lactamase regulating signal transducer with metallopeptidase domain
MAQADSARAVAAVYTLSVLASLPVVLAAVATFTLRRATADARVLVWRSCLLALFLASVGRLAAPSLAWVAPPTLAAPLVALGRIQVTSSPFRSLGGANEAVTSSSHAIGLVGALCLVYLCGVVSVLVSTLVASVKLYRAVRGEPLAMRDAPVLAELCGTLGISRAVRLLVSPNVNVPMTWGILRPVIVLPDSVRNWTPSERRIALFHELAHIRSSDWAFNVLARVVCALYWFHPGVWWIARGLHEDCELACDDRVLNAGVRRSDYAELLVKAADALRPDDWAAGTQVALSPRATLRARLVAVLDTHHAVQPLARGWALFAAAVTLVIAAPMSAVRLTPSREVLTTLMGDTRWESRAYAVVALAQRADSVAIARSAAERDPSPRVRAWARYALGEPRSPSDIRVVLHD